MRAIQAYACRPLNLQLLNDRRILMNAVQKRLSVVGLTVVLIFLVCVPLYGSTGTRHVFYLDSGGHVHQLYSTASGWSDVDVTAMSIFVVAGRPRGLTRFFDRTPFC